MSTNNVVATPSMRRPGRETPPAPDSPTPCWAVVKHRERMRAGAECRYPVATVGFEIRRSREARDVGGAGGGHRRLLVGTTRPISISGRPPAADTILAAAEAMALS